MIRLWEEDPEPILDEHAVPLYVLLPAMKDPTVDMLRQAIREIYEYYDSERVNEHLAQFHIILRRTTTVSDDIKDMIGKELYMSNQYAEFVKQHPYIDEEIHRREDKLLAKGRAEGEVEVILQLLSIHFSEATAELVELALRKVDIRDAEVIGPLKEATTHLDEQGVNRWVKAHLPTE